MDYSVLVSAGATSLRLLALQEKTFDMSPSPCCFASLECMARSRTIPATGEDSVTASGGGEDDASAEKPESAGVQPLSRAQRLRQQSNMSFWLILKKKNDLQAKAERVQELRAVLERIR